jgi:hypothetical protein
MPDLVPIDLVAGIVIQRGGQHQPPAQAHLGVELSE